MTVPVVTAQPPEAAMVLVTTYVPGVEVEGVMAPVVVLNVKPIVELNVPAVAPAANTTGTAAVAEVQYAVAA